MGLRPRGVRAHFPAPILAPVSSPPSLSPTASLTAPGKMSADAEVGASDAAGGYAAAAAGGYAAAADAAGDIFSDSRAAVDALYHTKETFFTADPEEKESRLQNESRPALQLLDSIPLERRKSLSDRATYEFLRGKILDVGSEYVKEAEDHLSKAVKLDPSLAEAWLCLSNCIWKKGDFFSARDILLVALDKGPDKKLLCQLSMLERKIAQEPGSLEREVKDNMVEDSIEHAKEAIALDVSDGYCWYHLGNAYLTGFFYSGCWEDKKLVNSLKAYQNAERDDRLKSNPDLFFNCATVNLYLENYERALAGFEAASLIDPSLLADEEVEKTANLLDKLMDVVKNRGFRGKAKKLASLKSMMSELALNPYKKVNFIDLFGGVNKSVSVSAKILLFINNANKLPLYYLVCDSDMNCIVLSVFGLRSDAIKEGDDVTLVEPNHRDVDFCWKGKRYNFKSIRVEYMGQILVNGQAPPMHMFVTASFQAQFKA